MFKFRQLAMFFAVIFPLASAFCEEAPTFEYNEKTEKSEMDALRRFIRDKRLITVKELGGDLSLSGEARTEFQSFNETKNGIRQRGHNAATPRPARAYDVEVNLQLDYRSDRAWGVIKLEFDNDMGIVDGTMSRIALEKAYFGGRMVNGDTFTFDAELGRRFLGTVFDSKIEFGSLFDGGLLRFNKAFVSIGDFYTLLGTMIVDEKLDYYAYIAEIGMLNIGRTGLYTKLSYVDWKKYTSPEPENLRYNFRVSQVIVGYQFTAWKKLVRFYAAGLYNDAADKLALTGFRRLNGAWYVGVSIGQVRKKGDWAIDTNYQWVQAQAIPDFDASGIGRGNAANVGFYTNNLNGSGGANTQANAVGKGNYKGWVIDVLYAFTSNITMLQSLQISHTLDKSVGPNLKYKSFEIEFIYAF